MKKLDAKEILIPTVSLLVICIVVTACLAVTNHITAPKIAALQAQMQEEAKKAVLKDASSFSEEKTVEADGAEYSYFEGFSESGENAGFVFSTSAKGYGGDIAIMVGVDQNGKVAGLQLLTINETAGLGMNAKNDRFLNQFLGKQGEIGVAKSSPKDNEIQALTGATITSKAVTEAVNTALKLYTTVGGAENG